MKCFYCLMAVFILPLVVSAQFYDARSIFFYLAKSDPDLKGKGVDYFLNYKTRDMDYLQSVQNELAKKSERIRNMSLQDFKYRFILGNNGGWDLLTTNNSGLVAWFVNYNKIVEEGDIVRTWIRVCFYEEERIKEAERLYKFALEYREDDARKWLDYAYGLRLYEFDFKKMQSRRLRIAEYSKFDEHLKSSDLGGVWEYPVPETVGEAIMEKLKSGIEYQKMLDSILERSQQ